MGKNWAIAVGINDYYNLQPLHYAVQDAESVRDFFLSQPIPFEQVYYFSDHSPAIETPRGLMRSLPTYANLKRFLRDRFQQPFLEMGDNFWFFFAGHGELHEGHDYLMPIDADPGNVEETALRIGDITAYLRNSGADNVILLLDACRSQGKRGQGFGSEEQSGMVTIYSCSPREASYEIDELQHGSFTYALLEGLHLQGVQNCATVERLDQYLRYQVPDLNQRHGKPRQTPYTAVEPISKNHLILLPRQSTLLADVQALKNAAFEAETEQNILLAEQLWIRVLAVSPADQQAIKAIKRLALLGVAEVPNVMGQAPLPESTNGADDSEDPQIRAIRRQHELDVLKTNLEIKRIDADFFKAQQEHEFESRLIDAELQGFIKARQGKPPQPKRTKKSFPPPVIQVFKFDVVTVNEQGREISRQQGQAQFYLEDLGAGVQLEMVAIPDGTFCMGSPDTELEHFDIEGPQHQVTIKSFWMSKFPVTQAQWRRVAGLPKINRELNPEPSNFKGDNRPVEQVSWYEVVEFCDRLSHKAGYEYRLPSEAEWKHACRAGTTTPFHFGKTIIPDLVNYDGNFTYASSPQGKYREQTTEVGSFPPNAFGLYDMHGNVWEWCLDHWHGSYEGTPTDGSAWLSENETANRLSRGGSWVADPGSCRSASRHYDSPAYRFYFIGFRVVCSAPRTL